MRRPKKRTLKQLIRGITKQLVAPAVRPTFSQVAHQPRNDAPALPTGFRPLDKALDVGGLPCGAITELIGPMVTPISGGATGIAASIAAKKQRQQQIISLIDLTRNFDLGQAEQCGLVAPQLLLHQPDTLIGAIAAIEQAVRQANLVIVMVGLVEELVGPLPEGQRVALLRRFQQLGQQARGALLLVTALPGDDPLNPAAYPTAFSLADIANVRLWIGNESWSHKNEAPVAYKANLTVIKNDFGMVGKGANVRVKFEFGPTSVT